MAAKMERFAPALKREGDCMEQELRIRETVADDLVLLEKLYPCVFPEEDLRPLLRRLMLRKTGVLSLVALRNGELSGHVAFTECIAGEEGGKVSLLGPLAVSPCHQRRGIGSALVREGMARLSEHGFSEILVLGDPAYYGRFGFVAEEELAPPYPLPEGWAAAWQSLCLSPCREKRRGKLVVPKAWRDPALWSP